MSKLIYYHLALGSNLGDRLAHLHLAITFLSETGRVEKCSPVYETSPVGMAATGNFFNMAVQFTGNLQPLELLRKLKQHEAQSGRQLAASHFQPRPIDIDILLAGNLVLNLPELIIPHPRMHERAFVLYPLRDIAPQLIHPQLQQTIANLAANIPMPELLAPPFAFPI